jgi:hypothetical protein
VAEVPPANEASPETPDRGRSLRRAATLTAGVGALHAIIFLLAFVLLSGAPGAEATDEELIAYYSSPSGRLPSLVALYLMPFAAIAFMWFIVALRMWETFSMRRESQLLSNIQLVSGILYIALLAVGSAAQTVVAASVEFAGGEIDPVVARQFPVFGSTVIFVFAVRMAAVFVFTTSNLGRTARVLPRWFAYVGFVVGLFMLLSVSLTRVLLLVFPLWLLLLSVILLVKARSIPRDVRLPSGRGERFSSDGDDADHAGTI